MRTKLLSENLKGRHCFRDVVIDNIEMEIVCEDVDCIDIAKGSVL